MPAFQVLAFPAIRACHPYTTSSFVEHTSYPTQLRQFWDTFRTELVEKGPYQASIGGMRLRLQELQGKDPRAQEMRVEGLKDGLKGGLKEGWEYIDGVLHHQGLPYVSDIVRTELIIGNHNGPLAGHFGIEKTRELVARKYYWKTLRHNVENYFKGCDVY